MNLGQMLLVVGAIALLGIVILNANSTVYQTTDTMYNSEFGITSVSLATSIVEEASGKYFDEVVTTSLAGDIVDSSKFTVPSKLGPDSAEAYPNFDDFDDFNGLNLVYMSPLDTDSSGAKKIVTPGIRAKYYLSAKVEYVQPPNLDAAVLGHSTWHKKITVKVWSPSAKDTLNYPSVMSYWN